MQDSSIAKNLICGVVAAALAVVTAHQGMIWLLTQLQMIKGQPWNLATAVPPFGVPQLINGVFWGGLWGALFGLIHDKLPGGALWLKGLLYGLMIVVVSNWLLLPIIKGQLLGQKGQVLFAGGDPVRMLAGALILGAFGLATAIFYGLMTGRR